MKQVCVTINCEKFNDCKHSAINNTGWNEAHSYGTEGFGCVSNQDGIQEETLCGPKGNYKMFKPAKDK